MPASACIFCQIGRIPTTTRLLYQDERVVGFQDINPSAFRHYSVIPIEHIPTVKNLERGQQHYTLVSHMLNVGKSLLQQDAAQSNEHRFGFHQPRLIVLTICTFIAWHFLLYHAGNLLNTRHWGHLVDSFKQRRSWRNLSPHSFPKYRENFQLL